MKLLAPGVLARSRASEQVLDGLLRCARALLDHEITRRRAVPTNPNPACSPTDTGA